MLLAPVKGFKSSEKFIILSLSRLHPLCWLAQPNCVMMTRALSINMSAKSLVLGSWKRCKNKIKFFLIDFDFFFFFGFMALHAVSQHHEL